MRSYLSIAFAALFVSVSQAADPLAWTNPILPQRADPHVFLHRDGFYYFTATVPEYDRIEIRRARTLGELSQAEAKVIWRKHDSGPMSHHIWAPEIHCIDDNWYLYFAAGQAEDRWRIRMYALENASPDPFEGRWVEQGEIKMPWDSFTLDATTFVWRGIRYFSWAQSDPKIKANSNIYLAKMDTALTISGPPVRLATPEHPWEMRGARVNEAPAFMAHGGHVFIAYSASATDANYCLGLLTAKADADLLDPASWTKSPEPVFQSDAAAGQFGPGHHSFTTTPDGKTDILVYHSRSYEKIRGEPLQNPDRATRAQTLRWNADGMPDFGKPVPDGPYRVEVPVSSPVKSPETARTTRPSS